MYCQWEEYCCGDGRPVTDDCFVLAACACKIMDHPSHYKSFDGRKHPRDRRENRLEESFRDFGFGIDGH